MARPLALSLVLDRAADPSLSSQLAGQIREGILAGTLPVGAACPAPARSPPTSASRGP